MKSEEERIYDRAVELSEVLQEKNLYKTAFDLACKRLEILDKKLGGTCQLNSEQYENTFLNLAECCIEESEVRV